MDAPAQGALTTALAICGDVRAFGHRCPIVARADDLDLGPAFVKIDVEGSELRVLRGLAATLERCQPILLVERSGDFQAIQQLLEARGYSAYGYQGRRRAVRSLHLCRRRSQRVLHASRGDSPRRLRALR